MSESSGIFRGAGLACERGGRLVFARLDFALGAGELLVLRGANGSGKSTLLRVLAGLTPVLAGEIEWNGVPVLADRLVHNSRCHYLGHQDALKPVLTVRQNLEIWHRLWGGPPLAVDGALARLGIGHLADLPARLLSAGQRRRLALARLAVVPRPLWLLDEPATSLDADGSARLDELLRDHLAGGGLAVLSSHGAVTGGGRQLDLADFRPTARDIAA
jgi:heme exporter protein A